jgi:septal ring factor EnvC (AmiA/AmiB activator)
MIAAAANTLADSAGGSFLEDLMARGRPRKNQGDVLMKSAEMIGWALGGLEREIALTRERLGSLTAQAQSLRSQLMRGRAAAGIAAAGAAAEEGEAAPQGRRRRRRKMSPEARKRISEMMKKRWAERRKKGHG